MLEHSPRAISETQHRGEEGELFPVQRVSAPGELETRLEVLFICLIFKHLEFLDFLKFAFQRT